MDRLTTALTLTPAFFNAAASPMAVLSGDGTFLAVNSALATALAGGAPTGHGPWKGQEIIASEDWPRVMGWLQQGALPAGETAVAHFVGDDGVSHGFTWLALGALEDGRFLAILNPAPKTIPETLAVISHELRNPLNAMLGAAEILVRRLEDQETRGLAQQIQTAGQIMLALLNDVLDLSKAEAGALTLESRTLVPAELAAQVTELFRQRAEAKGLKLTIGAGPGADKPLLGDPLRLMQILQNLLANSIKFTETGEVAVNVAQDGGGQLILTVSDTGIGMDAQTQARLFKPYVQADASIARRFGGTGLGLSIVKRLVTAMGGTITVSGKQGKGSKFTITLPLPPAPTDGSPDEELPPLKVLVADDDAMNLQIAGELLAIMNVKVSEAQGGADAIAQAGAHGFDLLLIDISMPDISGPEVLAAIRAGNGPNKATPAIAVTAHAAPDQIAEFIAKGFTAHLAKPLSLETLYSAMLAALEHK